MSESESEPRKFRLMIRGEESVEFANVSELQKWIESKGLIAEPAPASGSTEAELHEECHMSCHEPEPPPTAKAKVSYVGAPAVFALTQACQQIDAAFDGFGCYLVGSAIVRPDYRDVDIRYIMGDDEFRVLFCDAHIDSALWEYDPRWLLLTVSISEWLRKQTGLPVDFQIQPQTFANKHHKGVRHPIGLRIARPEVNSEHK